MIYVLTRNGILAGCFAVVFCAVVNSENIGRGEEGLTKEGPVAKEALLGLIFNQNIQKFGTGYGSGTQAVEVLGLLLTVY